MENILRKRFYDFFVWILIIIIPEWLYRTIVILGINGINHFPIWEEIIFACLISVVLHTIALYMYDWFQMDLLLFEKLKSKTEIKNHSSFIKRIIWIEKYLSVLLCPILIFIDPIINTIFYRKGHYLFDGLRRHRTRMIYLASILFHSCFWVLFGESLTNMVKEIMHLTF